MIHFVKVRSVTKESGSHPSSDIPDYSNPFGTAADSGAAVAVVAVAASGRAAAEERNVETAQN